MAHDAVNFHSLNFPRVYLSKGSIHMNGTLNIFKSAQFVGVNYAYGWMEREGSKLKKWSMERDENYIVTW